MAKGRPPLEPHITALEKRVEALEAAMLEMAELLGTLKGQAAKPTYEPLFTRWPQANGKA